MNPVVHFELPYANRERAERFYAQAFGWNTQFLGPAMGDYVLVTTVDPAAPTRLPAGGINGGLFPRKPDWPAQHPSVVIGVADIAGAMTAVRDAGGEVLGEPMAIPGVGDYVSFLDTEGNRISILQPSMEKETQP
ncbi:MAG: VOC family protein [Candidatus Latescibacteria bacterium]|nr:VOC family protein [Candidatus Latescibacterota bacterium]